MSRRSETGFSPTPRAHPDSRSSAFWGQCVSWGQFVALSATSWPQKHRDRVVPGILGWFATESVANDAEMPTHAEIRSHAPARPSSSCLRQLFRRQTTDFLPQAGVRDGRRRRWKGAWWKGA